MDTIRQIAVLAAGFAIGQAIGVVLTDVALDIQWRVKRLLLKDKKEGVELE